MTVEKLSISFDPDLAMRTRDAAEEAGSSLSAFVAEAVDQRLKLDGLQRFLDEWQDAHGTFTPEELRRAEAEWPG